MRHVTSDLDEVAGLFAPMKQGQRACSNLALRWSRLCAVIDVRGTADDVRPRSTSGAIHRCHSDSSVDEILDAHRPPFTVLVPSPPHRCIVDINHAAIPLLPEQARPPGKVLPRRPNSSPARASLEPSPAIGAMFDKDGWQMRTDAEASHSSHRDPATYAAALVASSLQRRRCWFLPTIRSGFRQKKECFSIAIDLFSAPLRQQQPSIRGVLVDGIDILLQRRWRRGAGQPPGAVHVGHRHQGVAAQAQGPGRREGVGRPASHRRGNARELLYRGVVCIVRRGNNKSDAVNNVT
jgi:hypothetical protein